MVMPIGRQILTHWRSVYLALKQRRGLGGVVVEYTPPTSEAAGSNLGPGASCWKVGSNLQMPGGFLHL